MANSGTTALTIKGAYLFEVGGDLNYTANNGSSNSGNTYSYGTGTNVDRALGSLASGGVTPTHFGLKLTNITGSTMNAMDLNYFGEQWRNGGNTSPDILYFEYSTDATSLSTGTWNTVNTLNMTSLQNTGTITVLDGNAVANRTNITGTLGLGNIVNNGSFWIRWRDINQPGNDHGMGVDDVILTPRFITPAIFYSKATGNLNDFTTWGDNVDGSGNQPANFTAAGQIFNIVNQASATIASNWTISGATSKAVLGNGTDPITFTVPSSSSYTGTIDVSAQGSLVLQHPSVVPTFGSINSASTVEYVATSGTQNVGAVAYGNLTFSGAGIKNITGNSSVSGNLVFDAATMDKTAIGFASITYAGNI